MTQGFYNQVVMMGGMCSNGAPGGSDGWQSMDSAPRDGTIVELKCTYGVAPWYGLFRWTDEALAQNNDGTTTLVKMGKHGWHSPSQSSGVSDEQHLKWRPATSTPDAYVDPTGGAQNSRAYWLQLMGDDKPSPSGGTRRVRGGLFILGSCGIVSAPPFSPATPSNWSWNGSASGGLSRAQPSLWGWQHGAT